MFRAFHVNGTPHRVASVSLTERQRVQVRPRRGECRSSDTALCEGRVCLCLSVRRHGGGFPTWPVGVLLLRMRAQASVWTCVFISRGGHSQEHALEPVLSQPPPLPQLSIV